MKKSYTIDRDGFTVEKYLRGEGFSRRLITRLKRTEGGILLNGSPARSIDRLSPGDRLTVEDIDGGKLLPNGGLIAPIAYEDEDAVVFDKPPGMAVHPSIGHYDDTLGNLFAAAYPGLAFRPINRLDRDTSGLCLVAKSAYAASILQKNTDKTYFAAVCGRPPGGGRIDAPIARLDGSVMLRTVSPVGKSAVTDYTVIKYGGRYTLLRIKLSNGRTHQIRVHFSHIGFPLAGDSLYGGSTEDIPRQALHCGELSFIGAGGKRIILSSPIGEDILNLFKE